MIRYVLFVIFIFVAYYAVKMMLRAVLHAGRKDDDANRLTGEEMIFDPECHTYVVKHRAISRRVKGKLYFFCSATCAQQYEEKNRM
jgi:YHS domain-containing protein